MNSEPVDGREHFLDLITDDVSAEFEGGAVQVFARGQLGPAVLAVPFSGRSARGRRHGNRSRRGVGRTAIRGGRPAPESGKSCSGVWSASGIGHDVGDLVLAGRDEQKPFAVDIAEHRPARGEKTS